VTSDNGVPRHIAIVMDGNRRWARGRHLPVIAGHRQGVETIRRTVKAARDRGVEYVTLYSFSTENWKRDADEVGGLMKLLEETIRRETPTLVQDGVRLRIIGRLHELSDGVRRAIEEAATATDAGTNGTMTIAFNYGGRAEIVDAVKQIVRDHDAGKQRIEKIDEASIAERLYDSEMPDPDLLIRTSGEQRISNFLLWRAAYAELWFTPIFWPDFNREVLFEAIRDFQKRSRRFGAVPCEDD
jgi:undecaprenyl diphosphate synthase